MTGGLRTCARAGCLTVVVGRRRWCSARCKKAVQRAVDRVNLHARDAVRCRKCGTVRYGDHSGLCPGCDNRGGVEVLAVVCPACGTVRVGYMDGPCPLRPGPQCGPGTQWPRLSRNGDASATGSLSPDENSRAHLASRIAPAQRQRPPSAADSDGGSQDKGRTTRRASGETLSQWPGHMGLDRPTTPGADATLAGRHPGWPRPSTECGPRLRQLRRWHRGCDAGRRLILLGLVLFTAGLVTLWQASPPGEDDESATGPGAPAAVGSSAACSPRPASHHS